MTTVEVVLRVPVEHEELAIAHLADFSPGGFRSDPIPAAGIVEFGVYVSPEVAASVEPYLARAGVPVTSSSIIAVDDDWQTKWKEFHKAVVIGDLWVGPPWLTGDRPATFKPVVIEPGQGFGTGAHPTTQLVLALLQEQPRSGVLDVGCGSGVLAVAAALLGFGPIEAIDNDPVAIDATRENLYRNDVESLVKVRLVDAVRDPVPRADLALANLTLQPLRGLAPRIHASRIIMSGLLRSQVEAAEAAYAEHGYVLRERRDREGWVALVLDSIDVEGRAMRNRSVF